MKVGILLESQAVTDTPRDFVSKSGAEAMCRRLTHVRVSKFLIKAVPLRQFKTNLAPAQKQAAAIRATIYEHHIEPRLERLTIGDSEWLAYLQGYGTFNAEGSCG